MYWAEGYLSRTPPQDNTEAATLLYPIPDEKFWDQEDQKTYEEGIPPVWGEWKEEGQIFFELESVDEFPRIPNGTKAVMRARTRL